VAVVGRYVDWVWGLGVIHTKGLAIDKEKAQHSEECQALIIGFLGKGWMFIQYKYS